ncbi:T6SS immunity protein Tli3 family protein, partial [Chimaeribacter arupi]|uniref:T6SS immunity protein Tli3 family protein n=1 Tax=Chimaeribacter arupi TaxID=2060066 RepID=UPI000C7CD700
MPYITNAFSYHFTLLTGALFMLSGCVSEGAAFGLGAGSLHETVMTEKDKNTPPPVYGPPQVIYRIDENRYFTLENYTRCEDGQTFYNNREKGIHTKISPASGYLFKGRLFWLSKRDDFLAFPLTRDSNKAVCIGSDKGCLNLISVTTDGGRTMRSVTYGSHTQDPTGDTEDYDMLVTDDGFYMIYYRSANRTYP